MPETREFSFTPGQFLACFVTPARREDALSDLLLVSGPSGVGKTTWCQALYDQCHAAGLRVAGLLSPAVYQAGQKTGIDLLELSSGTRRRLAERRLPALRQAAPPIPPSTTTESENATQDWVLDPACLEWGNAILQALMRRRPAHVLLLDEMGVLEFNRRQGLTAGLELPALRRYRLTCLTIRPSLLEQALDHWPWATVLDLAEGVLYAPEQFQTSAVPEDDL